MAGERRATQGKPGNSCTRISRASNGGPKKKGGGMVRPRTAATPRDVKNERAYAQAVEKKANPNTQLKEKRRWCLGEKGPEENEWWPPAGGTLND